LLRDDLTDFVAYFGQTFKAGQILNAPRNIAVNPFKPAVALKERSNRVVRFFFRFRAAADRRPEVFDDKARQFLGSGRVLQFEPRDAPVKMRVRRFLI